MDARSALPWLLTDGADMRAWSAPIYGRWAPARTVSLFILWICDVELDCSSVVLPHRLHQMQDMCS